MPLTTFDYKARDSTGKLHKGKVQADDQAVVAASLREKGFVPLSITQASKLGGDLNIPGITDRIDLRDVAVMSRQFATMVDSGLTLVRSLAVLAEQTEDRNLARILSDVRTDVEQGSSLSSALTKHPKAFTKLYVAMVRAGEAGGNLDGVLNKLSTTLEKQVELRRTVKSAMMYPSVVICVVGVIFTAMMVFIVPVFKKLFTQLHATLPKPTQYVVDISQIMTSFGAVIVVVVVIALLIAFRQWIKTDLGRQTLDTAKLKVPILGKVVHKAALARFSNTLSSLVSSGVPIVEALDIVADTSGNRIIETAIRDAREGIRNGRPLAAMLAEHSVMPGMVTQMIDTGEQTGALDTLLEKIAEFYDSEVKATVDSLTSILEPLLIVIIGAVVGSIVISLYLPMFDYIKEVQKLGASG